MYATIGGAARSSGLSIKAIRYYEAQGLLPRLPRTPSGYRLFSDLELNWLALLVQARQLGLPLREFRPFARRLGQARCSDLKGHLRALVNRRVAEIEEELARLGRLKAQLQQVASRLEDTASCDCQLSECLPTNDLLATSPAS